MKKMVKSLVCALMMMGACVGAQAQDAENAVGVDFGYMIGAESMSNFGIGIKYARFITENFRIEASGMYYFKGKKASFTELPADMKDYDKRGKDCDWFSANANAHYLFHISDQFKLYPIVGFAMMKGKTSMTYKDMKGYTEGSSVPENSNSKGDGYTDHQFRLGANFGAGAQYNVTDDFGITLEAKYKLIKTFGNFNLAVGCVVLF